MRFPYVFICKRWWKTLGHVCVYSMSYRRMGNRSANTVPWERKLNTRESLDTAWPASCCDLLVKKQYFHLPTFPVILILSILWHSGNVCHRLFVLQYLYNSNVEVKQLRKAWSSCPATMLLFVMYCILFDSMESVKLNFKTFSKCSMIFLSVQLVGSFLELLCFLLNGVGLCELFSDSLGLCQNLGSFSWGYLVTMTMVLCIFLERENSKSLVLEKSA